MSNSINISSGAQRPNLEYGDVIYVRGGMNRPAASVLPRGEKIPDNTELLEQKKAEWSEQLRNGTLLKNAVDLTDRFEQTGETDGAAGGKTIVRNHIGSITVNRFDPSERTAGAANEAARKGAPTHGFFYQKTDFLTSAAKEYATLADNEEFQFRNIWDEGFVKDALDFFTGGNYTQGDVNRMQNQMTDLVRELSKQVKNGEEPDLGKLRTKLTVGGADATISELLDMQKTGRNVAESMDEIHIGADIDMKHYGQMGIARAMGKAYGAERGEIGAMFASAVDRLYDKAVSAVNRAAAEAVERPNDGTGIYWPKHTTDAVKTDLGIADLFSKLDAGSKSAASDDFNVKLKQAQALIQSHCGKYGLQSSWAALSGAADGLMKYMQSWLER